MILVVVAGVLVYILISALVAVITWIFTTFVALVLLGLGVLFIASEVVNALLAPKEDDDDPNP